MNEKLKNQRLTQNDIVLLAALSLSNGDTHHEFTAEKLLIKAWGIDKHTFGLRGYEEEYPDSNILYTKLMGKSGLVRIGYLKKIGEKTYTITEAGLAIASSLKPTTKEVEIKIDRQLHEALVKIIDHNVFINWLKTNGEFPSKFRDAMWFWGIAPGTPTKTAEDRINIIEKTLQEAKKRVNDAGGKIILDARSISKDGKTELTKSKFTTLDERGSRLSLNIIDIERCIEFQEYLKNKFQNDLKMMLDE